MNEFKGIYIHPDLVHFVVEFSKNNVYVNVFTVTMLPCATRLINFSEKMRQHDILTTSPEINVYVK